MNVDETFAAVRAAYKRYPGLFANLNAVKTRDNSMVSWVGYESVWWSSMPSIAAFTELAEKRQYSFQTSDGGLVQLYYNFKRRDLIAASLAFLKPVDVEATFIDAGSEPQQEVDGHDVSLHDDVGESERPGKADEMLEEYADVGGPVHAIAGTRVVSWLRIDFESDEKVRRGIAHPACHMHVHGFPSWRLAIRGVPTPIQFVDLIVSQVYPEIYQAAHLHHNGTYREPEAMREALRNEYPCFDSDLFESAAHVYLPGVTKLIA